MKTDLKTKARIGDSVQFSYRCTDTEGTLLEDVSNAEITLGNGEILPVLEDALCGMTAGETKQVSVPPELGFGEYEPDLVDSVEKKDLNVPEDKLEIGMEFEFEEDGEVYSGRVSQIDGDVVYIDANHPLAGMELQFELTLHRVAPGKGAKH